MTKSIALIGGGAWGSALASVIARAGHDTRILVRRAELANALQAGISPMLDHMRITPPTISSTDPDSVLRQADAVIMSVPISATMKNLAIIKPYLSSNIPVAFAAKGLELQENALLPVVAAKILSNPLVMLSGPSFADEVASNKPAALVSASHDQEAASLIASFFEGTLIRVYTNSDPIGVAIGGAVKNVIAIASGIVGGLSLGDNARAALLTRGLAETVRFAIAMGGRRETLFGLAGIGDMALTCSGPNSRNFAFGYALATGAPPPGKLAEGQFAVSAIVRRAAILEIEMPITEAVYRVIFKGADPQSEIATLLARPSGHEWATE